ncbi:MAG: DUF2520 domain-containing protein [Chloroflexi bacterium]|nr:DUF2520 domain-containing protein [Chloroflexota bacterium]
MTNDDALRLDIDTPIGFVGAGRLGTSLAVALHGGGYRVTAVNSRSTSSSEAFAERVPGCAPVASPQDVADIASAVFITTPDGEIEAVCRGISWRTGQAAIHCSGVLPVSNLAAAYESGARTGGLHLLQTFPNHDSAGLITGAWAAVGSDDPTLLDWLQKTSYAIGAKPFTIRDDNRAAYHASAVMACGLVAALMGLAAEMWKEMGISRADALAALRPLTAATVEGVGRDGLPAAFTGPAVRGDVETVRMHLEATARHSPEMAHAYAALTSDAMPLFAEHEGLSPEARNEIEALLRRSLESGAPSAEDDRNAGSREGTAENEGDSI